MADGGGGRPPHGGGRDPHASPPASRRSEIVRAGFANVVLGLWLVASPFVLGYASGDPRWHDAVAGALIAVTAVTRLRVRPRIAGLAWVNVVIGAWVFAAAFWLAESAIASWNEAIVGALVAVLAAVAGSATESARRVRGSGVSRHG